MNRFSLMVLFAVALHLVQAIALSVDASVVGVTSIYAVQQLLGSRVVTAIALVLVSFMALWGLSIRSVGLMLPQQFLLVVGAAGATNSIWFGQYADGVPRPGWFLLADQAPIVLAALGHTLAVIRMLRAGERDEHTPQQER